ncbi:MAG: lipopolysaccharide biosynthesis protein [Hyphomonadaceae bacterium]
MSASARPTQAEINASILDVDHLKSGIGQRTARGGAIIMAAQVIRMAAQLVTTMFLARLLVPDDFGVVAIGYTILTFVMMFADLSLSSVTVQIKKLTQDTASALFYLNVGLALTALIVIALCAPFLGWVFRDDRIPMVAIGLIASAPVNALGGQHQALLLRNMKWVNLQILQMGSMLIGSIVAVLCAWLTDLGYWSLVVQAMVSAMSGVILAWTMCRWRPSRVQSWSNARSALFTSLNLSGNTILAFAHRQVDNMLIAWKWGPTELGYYSRAYNLLMLPRNLVVGSLSSAFIPALSRLQDDASKWRRAYLDSLAVVTIFGGAFTALLFGSSDTVIDIVLGPGWERAELIFSYLVIAMLVGIPMQTVVWIYVSLGRSRRMLLWGVIGTTAYVTSFIIGLPGGGPGVAMAYATAQVLAFIPCLWMATRKTSVTLVDVMKICLPLMAATLAVGFALRLANAHLGMFGSVAATAAGGVVYLGLVSLLVWFWPPMRSVRDRLYPMIRSGAGQALAYMRGSRSPKAG